MSTSPMSTSETQPDPDPHGEPTPDESDAPWGYRGARRRVEDVVRDDQRAEDLADRATKRAEKWRRSGRIARIWEPLSTSIRFLRAYARREYRKVPWRSVAALSASLLYLANPFDLLPDFIPLLGVIDDAAVLAWALSAFSGDLTRFREWEDARDDG